MHFGKGDNFANCIANSVEFSVIVILLVVIDPFENAKWLSILFSTVLSITFAFMQFGERFLWKMKLEEKNETEIKKARSLFLVFLTICEIAAIFLLCVSVYIRHV